MNSPDLAPVTVVADPYLASTVVSLISVSQGPEVTDQPSDMYPYILLSVILMPFLELTGNCLLKEKASS